MDDGRHLIIIIWSFVDQQQIIIDFIGIMSEIENLFGDDDDSDDEGRKLEQVADASDSGCKVAEIRDTSTSQKAVFAITDIPAGVLVTAEIPLLKFSEIDFEDKDEMMGALLTIFSDQNVANGVKELYPRRLEDADAEEVERARAMLDGHIEAIITKSSLATSAQPPEADEVIRVVLVLQHNGFQSGLYIALSMYNHSCEPNCIKFPPTRVSHASEIWTTRPVREGEELTISYVEPLEQSHHSFHAFLRSHHRFQCRCLHCASLFSSSPPHLSALPQSPSAVRDEYDEEEGREMRLQAELVAMEGEMRWLRAGAEGSAEALRTLKRLVRAADELAHLVCTKGAGAGAGAGGGADMCVAPLRLRARVQKVRVSAAAHFLELLQGVAVEGKTPKPSTVENAVSSYLKAALELHQLQMQYLRGDHPDMASTCLDVSEGIACLLRVARPSAMRAVFPVEGYPWAGSRALAVAEAARWRAEGQRVRALYDTRRRVTAAAALRMLTSTGPGAMPPPGTTYWATY